MWIRVQGGGSDNVDKDFCVSRLFHCASKFEVILIEQAAWTKVNRKPPQLDELTSFGQRETTPAILGLY